MLYEQPRLYDAMYDRFTDDIPFYLDVARAGAGPVCELACGSGRVTVPLASAGVEITGVDISPEMVAAARDRAARAAVPSGGARFSVGDMRMPQGEREFDAVLIPLHSLSHMLKTEDVLTTLDAVHRSLRPHGRLALAVHNPDPTHLARSAETLERIHPELSTTPVYESTTYHADTQLLDIRWYVESAEETTLVSYRLRMVFPEELLILLRYTGFSLEARYGWYDRSPFDGASGTQVVVARKA